MGLVTDGLFCQCLSRGQDWVDDHMRRGDDLTGNSLSHALPDVNAKGQSVVAYLFKQRE